MTLITYSSLKQPNETDDSLYLAWLKNNPDGFAFAFTLPDEMIVTHHSALCLRISRERATGAYTRRNYGKHCAENWDDVRGFMNMPGARVEECSTCARQRDVASRSCLQQ